MFEADDFGEVEVWPENWPAVQIFSWLGTQWRTGMSGPTGLHYEPLFQMLDKKGYQGDAWWRMFHDVQILEREALAAMKQ